MPVRVIVCDDSIGFPALAGKALSADPRFEHVGTATSGEELLDLAERVQADAVLLDLVLPDVPNPTALVDALRSRQPDVRVLLVSSLMVAELERAAIAAGADGFCHKATSAEQLRDALYRMVAPSA